jgi:hypothetical protein
MAVAHHQNTIAMQQLVHPSFNNWHKYFVPHLWLSLFLIQVMICPPQQPRSLTCRADVLLAEDDRMLLNPME